MSVQQLALVVDVPVVGACSVCWGERGLRRVWLDGANGQTRADQTAPSELLALIALLRRYFAGDVVDFSSVRLDDAGLSDFHRAIYQTLRRVPHGQTTTYGALARASGFDAGAARAVGVAMGRNPWPVIVPCHRVMAGGGKMGGFSAPGGTDTKARLLLLEGARHTAVAPRLPGLD